MMLKQLTYFLLICFWIVPMHGHADALDTLIQQEGWNRLPSLTAKAEAAYDWVREHIRYQKGGYSRLHLSDLEPNLALTTLEQRSGVCMGYASLTVTLFQRLGMEAIVVEGYSKIRSSVEAHAWIAFKVEGQWQLADPTWDAGYFLNGRYAKRVDRKYFRMPAEEFIQDHYPLDPAHQLLSKPLTYQEFIQKLSPDASGLDFMEILNQPATFSKVASLRRSLEFKPDDLYLQHSLGVALMDESKSLVDPCLANYNETFQLEDDCVKIIHKVKGILKEASMYFKDVLRHSNDLKQMAQINLGVVKKNLENLEALQKETQ